MSWAGNTLAAISQTALAMTLRMWLGCRLTVPGIEARSLAEFLPQRAFFVRELRRQLDVDDDVEIATSAVLTFRQTLATDAKLLAVVDAGRNPHVDAATERGNSDCRAEHRFPRGEIEIVIQVRAA